MWRSQFVQESARGASTSRVYEMQARRCAALFNEWGPTGTGFAGHFIGSLSRSGQSLLHRPLSLPPSSSLQSICGHPPTTRATQGVSASPQSGASAGARGTRRARRPREGSVPDHHSLVCRLPSASLVPITPSPPPHCVDHIIKQAHTEQAGSDRALNAGVCQEKWREGCRGAHCAGLSLPEIKPWSTPYKGLPPRAQPRRARWAARDGRGACMITPTPGPGKYEVSEMGRARLCSGGGGKTSEQQLEGQSSPG